MSHIIRSRYPDTNLVQHISFPEFILQELQAYGDRPALISPKFNKSYTFTEIIQYSRRLAAGLQRLVGLRKGHVVGTCLGNYMELFPLMLGVGLVGGTVNAANPAYTVRELVNQFGECGTRVVVTLADMVGKIRQAQEKCQSIQVVITIDKEIAGCVYLPNLMQEDPEGFTVPHIDPNVDIAFLLSSSGTTGLPKSVMLTHHSLVANMCQTMPRYLKGPATGLYCPSINDVILSVFPLFHIGGIIIAGFYMLCNGATSLIFHRFHPEDFIEAIRTYKVTTFIAPPPVMMQFTKSPTTTEEDFASIKYILTGAAVFSKSLSEAVAAKIKPDYIVQVYGTTELSPVATTTPLTPLSWQKHGSAGVLISNTQCKVIDIEIGQPLGPMKRGEICMKGPQIMQGYLNNPTVTKETIDADGWLHTGDIGYYDEDEYFYVVDRIKDTIKVKGFQVSPAELESILTTHPSIDEAAVIGYPDTYAGEIPRAYVVLKPHAKLTQEEVKKYLAARVVSYKRLEGGVRFVQAIPKTSSGKILRRYLREEALKEASKSKL